jgi:hypothetical protein
MNGVQLTSRYTLAHGHEIKLRSDVTAVAMLNPTMWYLSSLGWS